MGVCRYINMISSPIQKYILKKEADRKLFMETMHVS